QIHGVVRQKTGKSRTISGCWRSSTVEHLPCKQKAMGSSPVASSGAQEERAGSNQTTKEGFPSGQREQTVNLPPLASEVRILPPPPGGGRRAGVAQLVELQPSNLDVAGSSPVARSTKEGEDAKELLT